MKNVEYFYTYPEFNNIKEIMENSIKENGECRAFIVKDKEGNHINITYNKLKEDIDGLGTALFDLKLQEKRIAVVGKNSYMWALSYLSILMGNMVIVPLDKDLEFDELESSLVRSKVDAIIFDEKHSDIMKKIKSAGKTNIKNYICNQEEKDEEFYIFNELKEKGKELLKSGYREYINAVIDSDKMSILLFTSGTTSKSKAVMLSQRNVAENIYSMKLVEKFTNKDVNFAILPFHHMFGSTGLLIFLASGAANVFPDGLRYIAQNLKEYKVTVFVGVPLLIESIYEKIEKGIAKQGKQKVVGIAKKVTNVLDKMHIKVKRKVFKSVIDELGGELRLIISGAAGLGMDAYRGLNSLGIRTIQGYGLTETAPVVCAENDKYTKEGSVGFPMKNVQVEIVDKDEQGIGELRVKGPNVMLGYYENKDLTEELVKDGWYYTGDYGYIDSEGYIFITGRKKNMIVLKNGKKIFPEEVEEIINKIDLVKESMVFGLPKGEDVLLSVKVKYDEEIAKEKYAGKDEEELEKITWEKIKEVNKTLPTYKYIKNMIFTKEDFIKTTTAKIKRFEEMKKILENKN